MTVFFCSVEVAGINTKLSTGMATDLYCSIQTFGERRHDSVAAIELRGEEYIPARAAVVIGGVIHRTAEGN